MICYLSNASGEIVSQGTYKPHSANESYGFKADNSGDWVLFDVCERITSTPGKENGSIKCDGVGLFEEELSGPLSMYPNPAYSELTITSKSLISNIQIFDVNGSTVLRSTPNEKEIRIDLSSIREGVYIVRIECEDGVFNEKLVKQ